MINLSSKCKCFYLKTFFLSRPLEELQDLVQNTTEPTSSPPLETEHEPLTLPSEPLTIPSHQLSPTCNKEKIERGSTSIYIFEHKEDCMESVTNTIQANSPADDDPEVMADKPTECENSARNFKRSTVDEEKEEETVIIVRKRGNKVFIEL